MRISDWSSDVCSSDLPQNWKNAAAMSDMLHLIEPLIPALRRYARALMRERAAADDLVQDCLVRAIGRRSEVRRGGKEGFSTCRSWWSPCSLKNNILLLISYVAYFSVSFFFFFF